MAKYFNSAEGEEIIFQDTQHGILFTNRRVRQYDTDQNQKSFTSIMLEEIDSIKLAYRSNLNAVIWGLILIVIAGFAYLHNNQLSNLSFLLTLIGLGCVVYYFLSRKFQCVIQSSTAKISFPRKKDENDELLNAINKLEKARM